MVKSKYIAAEQSVECFTSDEESNLMPYKKKSRRVIIAVIITGIAIVTLALGLGLGIGLDSSDYTPAPIEEEGCLEFQRKISYPDKFKGKHFMEKQSCPNLAEPKCPTGLDIPPLLLISLDGYRAEYLLRNLTPAIQKLSDCGVKAPYMRSVYPTSTFPNHYTIVTGLYPESHGIIGNSMYDMEFQAMFKLSTESKFEGRWYEGEPMWNTAKKAGKKTATFFWPGSDAPIQGMYPDICYIYDESVAYEDRVDEVLRWLSAELDDIPAFMTLYFDQPDSAGHDEGPFGDLVFKNLNYVDEMIQRLLDGLVAIEMDECINLIIVADHGMDKTDCSQVVPMADYLDVNDYYIYDGASGRLTSKYVERDGEIEEVPEPEDPSVTMDKLACLHHNTTKDWYLRFSLKEDVPKRYHYANHKRIDDIIMDVEENHIVIKDSYWCNEGSHGYDNALRNMHALFLAYGPSFKQQVEMEPFESIELYNLMADLIDVGAAPNNGTDGILDYILQSSPAMDSNQKLIEHYRYNECPYPALEEEREERRQSFNCSCMEMETNKTVEELDAALDLSEEEIETSSKTHLPLGVPGLDVDNVCQLHQQDYITGYSQDLFMPLWTAFSLSKQQFQDQFKYHELCVRQDVRLGEEVTAKCSEYTDDSEGIIPTFLYPPAFTAGSDQQLDGHISSNLVPMYEDFVAGIWSETLSLLEEYASKYERIEVLTGPIFDYNADGHADPVDEIKKHVGDGKVPLPTHYFVTAYRCIKLVEEGDNCEEHLFISIVLPHKPKLDNCMDMWKFEYLKYNMGRVKDVELLTNLNLFPSLNTTQKLAVQTFLPVGLWERKSWMDLDDDEGCPTLDTPSCPDHYDSDHPPMVLISIDGLRPDYLNRGFTPTLQRLSSCGASAPDLRSIYPTVTYPNHYSLITGLYPESHGIIDNSMYDMSLRENFYLYSPNTTKPHWWHGEPLWNTVVRQNKSAMCMLWPGSDVEIGGMRPTDFYFYNEALPYRERVDQVLRWLNGSVGEYPSFITLYFINVDGAGHDGGPDSLEVSDSLETIDKYIKQLMDGIYRMSLDQCVNILITSDHGMDDMSCNRTIVLKDMLGDEIYEKIYSYTGGGTGRISNKYIRPPDSYYIHLEEDDQVPLEEILEKLECHDDELAAFDKIDFPRRHHYAANDRIDDILIHLIDKWTVSSDAPWCPSKGVHGWDTAYETMRGMFLAYGPSFKQRFVTESFESIELYNTMAYLVGVEPAPNNGTDGSLHHILRNPPDVSTKPPVEGDYLSCPFPEAEEDYERRANLTNSGCVCNVQDVQEFDLRLNFTAEQQSGLTEHHIPHGLPRATESSLCILHQTDFICGHSSVEFMPLWVAYTLNAEQVHDERWMEECIRPDVRLEPNEQANCTDYVHDLPDIIPGFLFSSELSTNITVMDSLLLSNVAPMMTNFYSDVWTALVAKISQWALVYETLHVVTGPIFDYDADGHKDQVTTRYLNNSLVPIPSHFYTILLKCSAANCEEMNYDVLSFILPNKEEIANCKSLDDYLIDNVARIRDIELLTDLEFLTATNSLTAIRKRVEIPVQLWT